MKKFILLQFFLIIFTAAFSVFAQKENASLEGFWTGAIEKDGKTWRVNLDVKKDGENYKAFADFIDVDAVDLEFSVKQTGEVFRARTPAAEWNGNRF